MVRFKGREATALQDKELEKIQTKYLRDWAALKMYLNYLHLSSPFASVVLDDVNLFIHMSAQPEDREHTSKQRAMTRKKHCHEEDARLVGLAHLAINSAPSSHIVLVHSTGDHQVGRILPIFERW